jgi:nitroreductase
MSGVMSMSTTLSTLLTAACRAPSGDNTQPWQFVVDDDEEMIELRVDPTRDRSPMNAGQRMARIAVGAALENILRTAAFNGWQTALEPCSPPALARVRVAGSPFAGAIDAHIEARTSNRRPYAGTAIDADTAATLRAHTPDLDAVRTCWMCNRARLGPLAELIGRADRLLFGARTLWQAILDNVRFDAPACAEVSEGSSLAALELSRLDQVAFGTLRKLPHWLVRALGAVRKLGAQTRRLVNSSSGLCLVIAPDDSVATDVLVGRALQRAWLALTAQGLAAQPTMSALVLANLAEQGPCAALAEVGTLQIAELQRDLPLLLPEIGGGRLAFLLRFGQAAAPSGRTGRLPWQKRTLARQAGWAARAEEPHVH